MTFDEFNEWWSYHTSCFVGISSWLARVTKGDNAPTARNIKKQWANVLSCVSPEEAKHATDKLFSGQEKEPKAYENHPSMILGIAFRERGQQIPIYKHERYIRGERTYSCLRCKDEGVIICWHPESMRAAKEGRLGQPFTVYSCFVRCTCKAGNDYYKTIPCIFDEKKWLPVEFVESNEERQKLYEFMGHIKPSNYEPAFAEFE